MSDKRIAIVTGAGGKKPAHLASLAPDFLGRRR
jgi:hypothetical protein